MFELRIAVFNPEEITAFPVAAVESSPEHRESLWAAARKVLVTWASD